MDFRQILQKALINVEGIKLAADIRTDLVSKGASLQGMFVLRLSDSEEALAVGVEEAAFNAAVTRLEGILDAKLLEDPLGDKFFSGTKKIKKSAKVKVPGKPFNLRDVGGRMLSEKSLVRILNIRAHDDVKEAMGLPALVYRTGRFAHSVKVTDFKLFNNTEKRNASLHFTYMLEPYQVFAGHKTRDPNMLIKDALTETLRRSLNRDSFINTRFNIGGPR